MRPRISRFTFAFLGLGICVFTWGLQYKLSLYYPVHSTYHQVPEAKLLSRNEQAGTTASLQFAHQRDPLSGGIGAGLMFLLLSWMIGLTFFLSPERGFIPALKKPWLVAAKASLDAFFFRPPPISA